MRMMDPDHPATRHVVAVIGEIWAGYIRTHTLAECEELNRRVEQNRAVRQQLFKEPHRT